MTDVSRRAEEPAAPDLPGEPGSRTSAEASPSAPDELPPGPRPGPVDYDPPWREARRRVRAAWGRDGMAVRVALVVGGLVAAALLGAFLFGLWHVVVGGFLRGNWNAGGFGFALMGVTGVLLWIEAAIARRLLPEDRAR